MIIFKLMNYPRKLTVIYAKNIFQYKISNTNDLATMVNKIKFLVTNSYHTPVVKVIWYENWRDFNLKTDRDFISFENFYKENLKLT